MNTPLPLFVLSLQEFSKNCEIEFCHWWTRRTSQTFQSCFDIPQHLVEHLTFQAYHIYESHIKLMVQQFHDNDYHDLANTLQYHLNQLPERRNSDLARHRFNYFFDTGAYVRLIKHYQGEASRLNIQHAANQT
jgi:hypothetical protein